jgi:O-antigen/teichoic acid export membrane protein
MSNAAIRSEREKETQATFLAFYIVAITRGLHYVSSFLLLFLLSPEDFGVMAIAMSFIAIMNSLSNFGVESALISYNGDEGHLLNDAWTLEITKGLFLTLVLALTSSFIAKWLSSPILADILLFLSLSFIFQSGKNIGLVSERKRFNFGVLFKCELAMAVTSLVTTVTLATLHKSPWALALGYVSGWVVFFLLSYCLCSFKPRLSFHLKNYRSLISYSKWILLSSQINTAIENGVNIFIGSHFGMSVLGQFERADMFTRKTVLQVGEVVWKIGLPSLSARASCADDLKGYYLSLYRFICFLVFPLLSVVVIYLPSVVAMGQEKDWVYLEGLLQILGFASVLTMLIVPAGVLFQACRVPEVGFKISLLRISSLLLTIYPLIHFYQFKGVVLSLLLSIIIVFPVSLHHVNILTGITIVRHLRVAMEYTVPCGVFLLEIFAPTSILNVISEIITLTLAYLFCVLLISRHARDLLFSYLRRK